MAEFREAYKLCPGVSIGARPGQGYNELILTFEQGSVQIYDVHSQSCISSWQLASDECLVCPAIYHHPSQNYWAVRGRRQNDNIDQQELISWGRGEDMGSGRTVNLPSSPIALLSAQTVDRPVVVYANGGVAVGGDNPQVTKRSKKVKKLVVTDVLQNGDVEYVCVVSDEADSNSDCSVTLWLLEGDRVKTKASSNLPCGDSIVSGSCLCGPTLITLSTKGMLCQWNLMDVLSSQSLSPIQSITLPSPPIKSHLVAVSVNYFVLVGVSTEGVCLSLWDTHYFTNQAGSLITSDLFTVCSAGNYVVVCGSESVTVAMVKTSFVSGTLAAALGRGHSSFDAITLSLNKSSDIGSTLDRQQDIVTILTDRNKTRTLEEFMSHFEIIAGIDYSQVVQRLLGETEFWGREALMKLLDNNLLPSSLVGDVLEAAMEKKDWGIASSMLCHCSECIPEAAVVKMLEAVLKLPDVLDGGMTREQLMARLLSVPVNDTLLHLPLSRLPFHTVILLLEWLYGQVGIQQLLGSTHPGLSYDSVLEWISILIDVHFTQLSLQSQARHLLIKLHTSVFKQVKCLDQLSVVGAVKELTKAPHPSDNYWLYKIEKLPINI